MSREQIVALTTEQLDVAYETSKIYLDVLLKRVESDNCKKATLQEAIINARLQYVILRARKFPKHFNHINTAA